MVEDIDDARAKLLASGASVVRNISVISTGRMMYIKHADGSVVECVQWVSDLVEKKILAPLRAGMPASQI